MSDFWLIAGLGNPGPRYANNRHNIGFQVTDALANAHRLEFSRNEHKAQTAHGSIDDFRVILAKPQTYMNDSGQAIVPLANYYKIPVERILVLYDDLDMPLGTIRYRYSGTSGGHRGVQSTLQQLGGLTLPRLKLGIGRPPGRMDPAAYVLQDFSEAEHPDLWDVIRKARELCIQWLQQKREFNSQGMTWRIEDDQL